MTEVQGKLTTLNTIYRVLYERIFLAKRKRKEKRCAFILIIDC